MTLRRLTPLLLVLALVLVIAGCGGDDDDAKKGTLAEPLSYLPKDSAIVAVFDTDVSGDQYRNLDRLLAKFPFGGQLKNQLKQSTAQSGVNYDSDLKPLLGNQLVFAAPDARSITDAADEDVYVVAFEAKDGGKLREVLGKDRSQTKGEKLDGADTWQSQDGSALTVRGDTLVGASDRPQLEAALKRKDAGDTLTEDDFNSAFEGLPTDAVMRVYGDAQALIASLPEAATARQVKWVGGLRKFAVTAGVQGDGVAVDARVVTEGVGEQDLPMASGDAAPAVARFGDYSVGVRDPSQMFRFGLSAVERTDPEEFEEFEKTKAEISEKLKVDIQSDLIGQLNGDTTVAGGLDGSWALRAAVKDPAAMKSTLDKMADAGRVGDTTYSREGGLIKSSGDGDPSYFGMVGDVFVAGPTPDEAKQLESVDTRPIDGAKGAFNFVADGEAIAKLAIQRSGQNQAAGLFTGPIGDLLSYVSATPGGLRAHAKLKIE